VSTVPRRPAGLPDTVAPPMRILFQMPFPGYLRMYGSIVRALAERGHEVVVTYDKPGKRRDPAADQVEDHRNIEVVPPLPSAARRAERSIARLRVTIDYLRYLDPRYARAAYLRRRLDGHLDGPLRLLRKAPYGMPFHRSVTSALLALERRIPADTRVTRAVAATRPDVVVVTPLLGRSNRNRRQTDTVKSARALGVPVAAGIATWDHLTTKGVIKEIPDRLFVWNAIQLRDAVEFHRVPEERIVVTGAQLFDRWFDRPARTTREELAARLGLPQGPYVLYVGSSPNIAPPEREIPFVGRWLAALRESGDPVLAGAGVLVRPHPYNTEAWAEAARAGFPAVVAPTERPALPMSDTDEDLYFDSLRLADAVVGINTTAMVESFIARTPVLTIRTPEFSETQEGTLHFGELVSAGTGALQSAVTMEEHLAQLRATLADPGARQEAIDEFLLTFVRPHGLDRSATAIMAASIEELAVEKA
jgi:hypothetical protein